MLSGKSGTVRRLRSRNLQANHLILTISFNMTHPKYSTFKNYDYENWIRKQKCLVCHADGVDCHHSYHARRNSYLSLPLCRKHHREYHDKEWRVFEEKNNVDLDWEIINFLSRYLDEQ